jgi:hypothetical protein
MNDVMIHGNITSAGLLALAALYPIIEVAINVPKHANT